jgi:hypothetical protein
LVKTVSKLINYKFGLNKLKKWKNRKIKKINIL